MKSIPTRFFVISAFVLVIGITSCVDSVDDNSLPAIYLTVEESMKYETKDVCDVVYADGEMEYVLSGKINMRGGISRKYQKRSYYLELDGGFSFGGMEEDDDWILNANYIDKTFMRHKLSYDLFSNMSSINIAADCRYVEVYINEEYNGLYVLMQKLDASTLKVKKSSRQSVVFKDPPVFYEEKIESSSKSNYFQQKYPKIKKKNRTKSILAFQDFIFNSTDGNFVQNISKYIDLDNVIDWHLLLLLTNNSEGVMKNFLLYKQDVITPFRIAIWDYDHSFGRDGENKLNNLETVVDPKESILIKRLMELEGTKYEKQLKGRYWDLRSNGLFTEQRINEMISYNRSIIEDHITVNFAKWPLDGAYYLDSNTFNEEVQLIQEFVTIRLHQLDKRFE